MVSNTRYASAVSFANSDSSCRRWLIASSCERTRPSGKGVKFYRCESQRRSTHCTVNLRKESRFIATALVYAQQPLQR